MWISLSPQAGHEQAGRRPAVILSPAAYSGRTHLAVMCPITNQIKGYPFEVVIPSGEALSGAILADQLKSLDWQARDAELVCVLPEGTVGEALQKAGSLPS